MAPHTCSSLIIPTSHSVPPTDGKLSYSMAQPCTPGYREELWQVRNPTGGSCLSPLTRVGWETPPHFLFQDRGNRGSGHRAFKTRASAICTKTKRVYRVFVASPPSSKFLPACRCCARAPRKARPCCSACKLGPRAGAPSG